MVLLDKRKMKVWEQLQKCSPGDMQNNNGKGKMSGKLISTTQEYVTQ